MQKEERFIENLHRRYYTYLKSTCQRKVSYDATMSDLIEDCIQDCFYLAHLMHDELVDLADNPEMALWLRRTCLNRLLPAIKRRRREQAKYAFSMDAPDAEPLPDFADPIGSFVTSDDARQKRDQIYGLLTPTEKQVFDLYFVQGYTIKHTAQMRDASDTATKNTIRRIREKATKIDE